MDFIYTWTLLRGASFTSKDVDVDSFIAIKDVDVTFYRLFFYARTWTFFLTIKKWT